MIDYQETFPNLFQEHYSADGSTRSLFEFGTEFPSHLVGLVKMVAYIGDEYIAVRGPDGWWEPGGKLEPEECYLDTIRREMLEETGTQVQDFTLFGAFHCYSLLETNPRPGLLWPEWYFLWGYGKVGLVGEPCPTPHEQILEVAIAPLDEICKRLGQTPGAGSLLIDVYRLADTLRKQAK